jgi:putative heme degradation protein
MITEVAQRQELSVDPRVVLSRLSGMGRVMTIVRDGRVTHERIGIIERITQEDDRLAYAGDAHDCIVDLRHVALLVIDRSGRIGGNPLPKLEVLDLQGDLLFSVVGLDGVEKFDGAVAQFPFVARSPKEREQWEQPKLGADDAGIGPFAAANQAGLEIEIEMQRRGFVQRWSGRVPEVNCAMGFINLIVEDFHLHVRGGAISGWEIQQLGGGDRIKLAAIAVDGTATGLALRGAREAFQPT